jgi:hypothetical protein
VPGVLAEAEARAGMTPHKEEGREQDDIYVNQGMPKKPLETTSSRGANTTNTLILGVQLQR